MDFPSGFSSVGPDKNPADLLQMALQNAQSLGGALPAVAGMLDPATKHARKIYVGNLPVVVTEDSLKQFFNEALDSLLPSKQSGPAIIGCYLNLQRRFAFLEHRSIEEANFTLGLDGINFFGHALKLRRPQDYNPALAEAQAKGPHPLTPVATGGLPPELPISPQIPQGDLVAGALGIISTTVDDSPNKVFIGGLPHHLTETEVKNILSAFGPLRSFHLVKAQPTMPGEAEKSKGFAFCEWRDASITDAACASLNGMKIGDRVLNVRRAVPHAVHKASTLGVTPQQVTAMGLAPPLTGSFGAQFAAISPTAATSPTQSTIGRISRVVAIRNLVSNVVTDQAEVDSVLAEARRECAAMGEVRGVHWVPAMQCVMVEFATTKDAAKALNQLQGKVFDSRTLNCSFCDPTPEIRAAAISRVVNETNERYAELCRERSDVPRSPPPVVPDMSPAAQSAPHSPDVEIPVGG